MITNFKLFEDNHLDMIKSFIYDGAYDLLKNRIDDEEYNDDDIMISLLFYSIDNGSYLSTEILLNSKNFNKNIIDKPNTFSSTLLMIASTLGKYKTSKMLLDFGANPNIQNKNGYTALMKSKPNNWKLFKMLACVTDWSFEDHFGYDILKLIGETDSKKIIEECPKQWEKYKLKKDLDKFDI